MPKRKRGGDLNKGQKEYAEWVKQQNEEFNQVSPLPALLLPNGRVEPDYSGPGYKEWATYRYTHGEPMFEWEREPKDLFTSRTSRDFLEDLRRYWARVSADTIAENWDTHWNRRPPKELEEKVPASVSRYLDGSNPFADPESLEYKMQAANPDAYQRMLDYQRELDTLLAIAPSARGRYDESAIQTYRELVESSRKNILDSMAKKRSFSGTGWEDELAKAVARDKLSQEDAATAKKLIADALASRDAALARSSKKTKTGSGLAGDAWDALRGLWDALRAILNPVESLEALFSHVIEYEPLNDQVGEGAHASRLPAKLPKLSPAQLEFLRDTILGSAQRVHQARKVSRVKAKRQLHSHLKPKAASNLYYLPSSRALHR